MIGKKEWFYRRKYSGWGLTPRTWQGFLYVSAIIAVGFLINKLLIDPDFKMIISTIMISVLVADVLHIMATIKLDEREAKMEALAERNASWAMVGALAILIIYLSLNDKTLNARELIPFVLFPMITGLIAKAMTAFLLKDRAL